MKKYRNLENYEFTPMEPKKISESFYTAKKTAIEDEITFFLKLMLPAPPKKEIVFSSKFKLIKQEK